MELFGTFTQSHCGEREPVSIEHESPLLDKTMQICDAKCSVDPKESFDETSIDNIAKAFAP